MKHSKFAIVLLCIISFSCGNKEENHKKVAIHPQQKSTHWSYQGETGPEFWSMVEKESMCSGKHQSPINIIDIDAPNNSSLEPLNIHYSDKVKIHDITNNGHSIQYNFEKGDYIVIDNDKFELKQIHFHEASEHTINGIRYPLEMHLVHSNSKGKIAVIGIMAIEGKSSEPFTFLETYLPIKTGETKAIDAFFDLNLNLPKDKSYYTYSGSLTTPPCSEDVSWFILKSPITVSLEQVKQLQALMPINNYRNEQPLNGRVVHQFAQ